MWGTPGRLLLIKSQRVTKAWVLVLRMATSTIPDCWLRELPQRVLKSDR